MEIKRNADVLLEMLELAGSRVLDIGCGQGQLARLLARNGARVTGIENNPDQIAKARAGEAVADETFHEGRAESLPFADASFDIVIFFNSLHHVPVAGMEPAMAEAARVLAPGGRVYVSEPVAEGPHFEVSKPVEDETEVRAAAYAVIREAERFGLSQAAERTYVHPIRMKAYAEFRARLTSANPERNAYFDANEAALRASFEAIGERREDGWWFDQPTRVNLLVKRP